MARKTDIPPPNIVFATIWALWYVGVLYYNVVVDSHPLAAVSWIAGMFWFEYLALKLNWRWTLSAVVTWCVKRMSKHDKPFRGWNNIVPLVAFPISTLIVRTCDVLIVGPFWWGWFVGLGLAVPVFVGLHDHWLKPSDNG